MNDRPIDLKNGGVWGSHAHACLAKNEFFHLAERVTIQNQ